jgi:hypothetical protein
MTRYRLIVHVTVEATSECEAKGYLTGSVDYMLDIADYETRFSDVRVENQKGEGVTLR